MKAMLVPFNRNKYTSDTHFMVSEDKFEEISKYKWFLDEYKKGHFAIKRNATKEERAQGAPYHIKLHRQIMGIHLKKGNGKEVVDHIDRNRFNNTNENLRIVTAHKNCRNSKANTNIGKGLFGASFRKGATVKPWEAQVWFKRNKYRAKPSCYATEEEAHEAAIKLYFELHGEMPLIELKSG